MFKPLFLTLLGVTLFSSSMVSSANEATVITEKTMMEAPINLEAVPNYYYASSNDDNIFFYNKNSPIVRTDINFTTKEFEVVNVFRKIEGPISYLKIKYLADCSSKPRVGIINVQAFDFNSNKIAEEKTTPLNFKWLNPEDKTAMQVNWDITCKYDDIKWVEEANLKNSTLSQLFNIVVTGSNPNIPKLNDK